MFHTVLTADLPSVEQPGAARGDDDFAPTHDSLSFGSAQLLDLLRRTFAAVGVTDVAWVRVDAEVVYEDENADSDDEIGDLLMRAARGGFLGRPFQELELGLVHVESGVRHVLQVTVRAEVPAGEPELLLRVASTIDELLPQAGETPEGYAARLTTAAARETPFLAGVARVQALRDQLKQALQMAFHQSTVFAGEVVLTVVRPDREALDALADLPWGDVIGAPLYDLAPTGRWPHWDELSLKVYDDPTLVARHLLLLEAIMAHGHLHQPWVQVCDGEGKVLFDGSRAAAFANWPWRRRFVLDVGASRLAVRWV
ncbi:MAG: hypothetical protein H6733_16450 [Alphaproteobacteria bacterium]|nr:hypothetical protein [Alphaproteobacteria bacterium]